MTTDRCRVCDRKPEHVNNDRAECSHIDCPHRRRCWSDGAEPGYQAPQHFTHPLDEHFDQET